MSPGRLLETASIEATSTPDTSCLNTKTLDLLDDKQIPIAVVGLAVKLPQDATSAAGFWKMLCEGRCAMTEYPPDRMNIDSFYHEDPNRLESLPLRGGHFLEEDIKLFDAPFFSISANEAISMDPQQRGLMEITYLALENAGIPIESITKSRTSVYVGSFTNDYFGIVNKDPELRAKYAATGLANSILANRISWFFDLRGPSMQLDAACSSSLIAFHQACQSIRLGESSMALAGGCNLLFNPVFTSALTNLNFLSHDSRCWSFDERANGYGRGEGFGMVVLKRLDQALRDGDTIRAVVRGSGVNQDGHTAGLTQPNEEAQQDLIQRTYDMAGIDMKFTRYFEAHGTGTPIGDPIEARAIGNAFAGKLEKNEPLYVGALKSNVGHLEGTSGIAGVVKAILVMEQGVIPPNTNFEKLNPLIDTESLNIKFPLHCTPWPSDGLRRSSVNCFGFGGSNSHVILDDAFNYLESRGLVGNHCTVKRPPSATDVKLLNATTRAGPSVDTGYDQGVGSNGNSLRSQDPYLLFFSAADEAGIERWTEKLEEYLSVKGDKSNNNYFMDLVYTLACRRSHLPWRSYSIVRNMFDIKGISSRVPKPIRSLQQLQATWIFTGQGAQWPRMGLELTKYPIFKHSLRQAEEFFIQLGCPWSLLNELSRSDEETMVNDAAYAQPLCTAIQIALVDLLYSFGLRPEAVVGHSSGEIAAAYCSGNLDRESSWQVAYYRGLFAAKLARADRTTHGMLAIGASEDDTQTIIKCLKDDYQGLQYSIACINSPHNVTVSGESEHLNILERAAMKKGIFARRLRVHLGYHSSQMKQIAGVYKAELSGIRSVKPKANAPLMVSSVTGRTVLSSETSNPEYWIKNLVQPVRFSDALGFVFLKTSGTAKKLRSPRTSSVKITDLVEIGPHPALKGPIREVLQTLPSGNSIRYMSTLKRGGSDSHSILELAGQLHCLGYSMDLQKVNEMSQVISPKALTDLPHYSFNHTRPYWVESRITIDHRFRKLPRLDLLGTPSTDWNPLKPAWRNIISTIECPWIEDHKIDGVCLYPGAGMLVMAIEAANQLADPSRQIVSYLLRDVEFKKGLQVSLDYHGTDTTFHLEPVDNQSSSMAQSYNFNLYTYDNKSWSEVCSGSIRVQYAKTQEGRDQVFRETTQSHHMQDTFQTIQEEVYLSLPVTDIYQSLKEKGLDYGVTFQGLQDVQIGHNCATAGVDPRSWRHRGAAAHMQKHTVHPTTIDALLQLALTALNGERSDFSLMVPTRLARLTVLQANKSISEASSLKAAAKTERFGFREARSDLLCRDEVSGEPLLLLEGLETTEITTTKVTPNSNGVRAQLCYNLDLQPDIRLNSNISMLPKITGSEVVKKGARVDQNISKTLSQRLPREVLRILDTLELYPTTELSCFVDYARTCLNHKDSALSMTKPSSMYSNVIRELRSYANTPVPYRCLKDESTGVGGEDERIDCPTRVTLDRALISRFTAITLRNPWIKSQFSSLVKLHAHYDVKISILVVGPGSISVSKEIHSLLREHGDGEQGVLQLGLLHHADLDSTLIESSPEIFSKNQEKSEFRQLDLNLSLELQGFSEIQYDLIIVPHLSLWINDASQAMSKLATLLRPEGSVIWLETINRSGFLGSLAFGLFSNNESYSEPEHIREMNESNIDQVLEDTSLARCLPTSPMSPTRFEDVLVLAKKTATRGNYGQHHFLLVSDNTSTQNSVARAISKNLQRRLSISCTITSLEAAIVNDTHKISAIVLLPDLERALLRDIEEEEFAGLKKLLLLESSIIWLAAASSAHGDPVHSTIIGLTRTLRTEMSQAKIVTMMLEFNGVLTDKQNEHISEIVAQILGASKQDYEPEYYEQDGVMTIPRLVEAKYADNHIQRSSQKYLEITQKLSDSPATIMKIAKLGLLDTIEFHEDMTPRTSDLQPDEIEVEVKAVGVNFKDCLILLGRVSSTYIGFECSGVVKRAGHSSYFKPGDRICAAHLGSYRSMIIAKEACAAIIPDDMSYLEASALPATTTTVYYALNMVAHAQYGESILIHGGAGGTGQAAIQMSQLLGLEIFATVGSVEKRDFLIKEYHLLPDHIFYSRDLSFAEKLKKSTRNRGVNILINTLSGEALRDSWECMAPFGRFIELGLKDILAKGSLPMGGFANNVSFSAIDNAHICSQAPNLMHKLLSAVMTMVTEKRLGYAKPLHVFKVSEIEAAVRFLQTGQNIGKVVIDWDPESIVKNRHEYFFEDEATYVIAGGLGGLGRSITRWMIKRGARRFILLSRSGASSSEAKEFLNDLVTSGIQVEAPTCDITRFDILSAYLREAQTRFPLIKGAIQATMVLRDFVLENMSWQDFRAGIDPKVRGSYNMHKCLPKAMDFFIFLSSVAGIIGSGSQGNYAAGNTYEDALARYRVSKGECATSLCLGMMQGAGVLAQSNNETLLHMMRSTGYYNELSEDHLHGLLDLHCRPRYDNKTGRPIPSSVLKSQIITGINTPATMRARGFSEPLWMMRPMWRYLFQMESADGEGSTMSIGSEIVDYARLLKSATSTEEAAAVVSRNLVKKLARALLMEESDLDLSLPMHTYGVDSLVAVEVRNWLLKEIKADIAIFEILNSNSLTTISHLSAVKSEYRR